MTVIYDDLRERLLRFLDDVDQNTYEDAVIYDGIVAAHQAVMPWVPKFATATLTSGSDGVTFSVPSDCYQIEALRIVDTGEFLPKASMSPNTTRHVDLAQANDWIEYPKGTIVLRTELDEGDEITLYYFALWDTPADEADSSFEIEVPLMAHTGMMFYAASYCILTQSFDTSALRQYATRVDSGHPEHNPLEKSSDYCLKRFYEEMKLMPAYERVGQ